MIVKFSHVPNGKVGDIQLYRDQIVIFIRPITDHFKKSGIFRKLEVTLNANNNTSNQMEISMELQTPEKIIKESIPKLHFKNQDVLESDFDRELRNQNLFKAMILGNTYKKKVKIVFETADGPKMVETTVWASTERDILLKNGINIPIRSILEIKAA